jgi:hypothetical protein
LMRFGKVLWTQSCWQSGSTTNRNMSRRKDKKFKITI